MSQNLILNAMRTKYHIEKQEQLTKNWPNQWGWLAREYVELQKKMKELTLNSKIRVPEVMRKHPDSRSIFPVPEEVNHDYGWLASKPEFKLEIYGPDVNKFPPYKEEF